tara:strand:+ start:405 stop:614 length:210 start_codon:yes stop_codon:yes gene_type:complete
MTDKYGSYIHKLMTVVIDNENDEFVRQLAWTELFTLSKNIQEFLHKNNADEQKAQDIINKEEASNAKDK